MAGWEARFDLWNIVECLQTGVSQRRNPAFENLELQLAAGFREAQGMGNVICRCSPLAIFLFGLHQVNPGAVWESES